MITTVLARAGRPGLVRRLSMRDEVTVLVKAFERVPAAGLRLTGDDQAEYVFVQWGSPPQLRAGFLWRVEVADLVFAAWAPHREEG